MRQFSFERLDVWQRGRELCKIIYQISQKFPPDERFGATQQIRRAVLSITCNLAEGSSRQKSAEKARYSENLIFRRIKNRIQEPSQRDFNLGVIARNEVVFPLIHPVLRGQLIQKDRDEEVCKAVIVWFFREQIIQQLLHNNIRIHWNGNRTTVS